MAKGDVNVTEFGTTDIGGVEVEFPTLVEGDKPGQYREPEAHERARRFQTRLGQKVLRLDTLYPFILAMANGDTLATLTDLAEQCLKANNGTPQPRKKDQVSAADFLKMVKLG